MKRKTATITAIDLSPSEQQAREKANVPLDAPLTAQEIKAREQEKSKLLASITPPPTETPQNPVGLIEKFIARATAPSNALIEAERAECERIARPLLTEVKSLQTAMGILQSKWKDKVESYVSTDWNALRRATPPVLVRDEKARMMVDIAAQAIHNFQVAVTNARISLAGFGDEKPGPKEVNTVSLRHAAEILSDILVGDNHVSDKSWDGHSVRVLSATFRRGVVQLEYWLGRSRATLQGAEFAVERFVETERVLTDILAKLEPTMPEAQMKRATLPNMEERPERGTSSYVDFDPRSN